MTSCLYRGQVMHRRRTQVAYRFVYGVFALYLDIDELPALERKCRLFSHNRFNLLSVHDEDLASGRAGDLRAWVEGVLRSHDLDLAGGKIHVLTYPRVLGYGFSPLSVWYCHHQDGRLLAILAEVHNTFGERHHYLLAAAGESPWRRQYHASKAFHVSPFMPPKADYRFRFGEPGEDIAVFIHESVQGAPALDAAMTGARITLDDRALLTAFCRVPLLGLKIMTLIHWQALKIWLRGAPLFHKPASPAHGVTAGWMGSKN